MNVLQSTTKPSGKRQYSMVAKGSKGEIQLYGPIGASLWSDGITATEFTKDLKGLGSVSAIDVRINSDGGDVFEGRTMYNLLSQHSAKITVYVDGLAASIASLIAMAGDEIIMGDGAFIMVHRPWGGKVGTADDLRSTANLLDSVNETMITTYASRTKLSREDLTALLVAETWMPADEAVSYGFADKKLGGAKIAAAICNPDTFKNLPTELRPNRVAAMAAIERTRALMKS